MKVKNMKSGIVHESSELYNHELAHCGIWVTDHGSVMHRMYDDNGDVDVTCKNCLRAMGPVSKPVDKPVDKPVAGFRCSVSDEEEHDFIPFTLNMHITTKKSAQNLFEMIKNGSYHYGINNEQKKMAKDICKAISTTVADIES